MPAPGPVRMRGVSDQSSGVVPVEQAIISDPAVSALTSVSAKVEIAGNVIVAALTVHPPLTVAETVIVPDALAAIAALLIHNVNPSAARIVSFLFIDFLHCKVGPVQCWTDQAWLIFVSGRAYQPGHCTALILDGSVMNFCVLAHNWCGYVDEMECLE